MAKKYGVDRQRLAPGERGLQVKNVAMWMVWETGSKSLREIGELFGGLDYAAVASGFAEPSPLTIQLLHGG